MSNNPLKKIVLWRNGWQSTINLFLVKCLSLVMYFGFSSLYTYVS